jgi:predicted O-linked N-acetylglucosamine transferase (SPINDLY family)
MITHTTEEYVARALQLSSDPQIYRELKHKVIDGVRNSPLFDMRGFAADLEKSYAVMWEQYSSGCKMPIVIS